MNTLNLIRLNLNSPYEVWNESHDSYFFETDYGVKYKISFGDVKDGDQENFAAIIVQRNHPDLDSILETFDETISYFKDKP